MALMPGTSVGADMVRRYNNLKTRFAHRDQNMNTVALVREGRFTEAFPGKFGADWAKPIVANLVDVAARDIAEMLAPLPTFTCSPPMQASDAARRQAMLRTQIVSNYILHSKLGVQMYTGGDRYVTYGFLPIIVEPDFDAKLPRFVVDNPIGAYYEKDRLGNVTTYMKRHTKTVAEMKVLFPELVQFFAYSKDPVLGYERKRSDTEKVEVVYLTDDKQYTLFLPDNGGIVLQTAPNPMGECPVFVGERLGVGDDPRGQFDDVLWVQLARARFASLALEAATKAVAAPLAVPPDVDELTIGSDAIVRSQNPQLIRRVGIEMPTSAFSESALLEQELQVGSRYPQSRTGDSPGSVVTGKGVEALSAGFDSQIKAAQAVFADMFMRAVGLAFRMDEKLWPNEVKAIRGTSMGSTYSVKYKPSRDIDGDHWVDVQYGMLAGLDPNRALVFGLQARSDELISRRFLRAQLPFDINIDQEEQLVDVEKTRDALLLGMSGLAQALPAIIEQGQDPTSVILGLASVVKSRQAGVEIEKAVEEAFRPQPPAPESEVPGAPGEPAPGGGGAGGSGNLPPGMDETGRMQGVPEGQQGLPPGGRPDMSMLLAGLSASGSPTLQANVASRRPF